MIVNIPSQKTEVKRKQVERALSILRKVGAKEISSSSNTYGVVRLLDYLDDKNKIAKEIGNIACVKVLNVNCSICPVGKTSDECIDKLGRYLVTKGPKGRIK